MYVGTGAPIKIYSTKLGNGYLFMAWYGINGMVWHGMAFGILGPNRCCGGLVVAVE